MHGCGPRSALDGVWELEPLHGRSAANLKRWWDGPFDLYGVEGVHQLAKEGREKASEPVRPCVFATIIGEVCWGAPAYRSGLPMSDDI